ncbi:putative cytochrome b5-like heme/steroid binding domain superfamily [Arabidopsis thaliana]
MGDEAKIFTLSEVSEHNQAHDCWIVINGKVSFFFLLILTSEIRDLVLQSFPFWCLHEIKLLKSQISKSKIIRSNL